MTTWLNLMEVYWVLLRNGLTEEAARDVVDSSQTALMDFAFSDVRDAVALRLRWHRRRLRISYVDAIGYSLARAKGLRFLTGDPAFRGAPGVDFLRPRTR